MKNGRAIGALFLAIGFATVSAILILVEPGMGFVEPHDFLDPRKVLAALGSIPWLIGDLVYFGIGVALSYLASSSVDGSLRASGFTAAVLFVLLGSFGRVMAQLPDMIENADQLEVAILGILPVRLAVLRTTVLVLGVFAWRTTVIQPSTDLISRIGRILGYLVLAGGMVFMFVFIPIPLLLTIWSAWLAIQYIGLPRVL